MSVLFHLLHVCVIQSKGCTKPMQGKGKGINSRVCFPSSCCQIQRTTSKQYITKLGDRRTIIKMPLQEVMSLKQQLLQKAITVLCQRHVKLLCLGWDSKKKKKKVASCCNLSLPRTIEFNSETAVVTVGPNCSTDWRGANEPYVSRGSCVREQRGWR